MTPTVGDNVLFTFDSERSNRIEGHQAGVLDELGQSTTVPATVVGVFSDSLVNLRVHPDGPGPDLWESSCTLKDDSFEGGSYWEWPAVG